MSPRALQKAFDEERTDKDDRSEILRRFRKAEWDEVLNSTTMKRNISILDFLDFYDSYKQNISPDEYHPVQPDQRLRGYQLLHGNELSSTKRYAKDL
jgi:hypothetical protein